MASDQHDLATLLDNVSRLCLRGQPVPAVLRLLWEAQLSGERPLAYCDADGTLDVEIAHPGRAADVLGIDPRIDAPTRHAYERLFQEIAFIGFGGGAPVLLFGYWLHDPAVTVQTAPIIDVDSEGQFGTCPTLQDYVLNAAYYHDPGRVAALREWFVDRGIAALPSHQAIQAAARLLPDPQQRWLAFHNDSAGLL